MPRPKQLKIEIPAIIVPSTMRPGRVSLRASDGESSIRRALTAAGFLPRDIVRIKLIKRPKAN